MKKLFVKFLQNYAVSNYGEVVNLETGQLRTPQKRGWYLSTNINGVNYNIHRIVADNFVDNPKPNQYNVINHIDNNPYNNRANNLEWCTQKMNIAQQMARGTHTSQWSEASKSCRAKAKEPSRITRKNKTGYKGITIRQSRTMGPKYIVHFNTQTWGCRYLGTFETLEKAKEVYNKEHVKRYGVSAYSE
jgi:hypothetical protein